jgi:hypothetical protein
MSSGNRRLFFHGFVYFSLAPLFGFLMMAPVANPRAMMSLHVAAWLSGALLCAAGAAWPQLALSARWAGWTERGLLLGMWLALALGAMPAFFGTPTLFAGGGASVPAWTAPVVVALQLGVTVSLIPALLAIAIGLGKKPVPPARPAALKFERDAA